MIKRNKFLCICIGVALSGTVFNYHSINVNAIENSQDSISSPVMISEVVPDTDNLGGSDAYEFFEIYNISNKTINMDDFDIIYNYSDLWSLDQGNITIEPGQALTIWIINEKNTSLTESDFNDYYGTNLILGKNIVTVHSGGLHNSKERELSLFTKTGNKLVSVKYNDDNVKKVQLNKGITFEYNYDDVMEVRQGYDKEATPGKIDDDQKPSSIYEFNENSNVKVGVEGAEVQSFSKPWNVKINIDESVNVFSANLYIKGEGEEKYSRYEIDYKDNKLSYELPYSEVSNFSNFTYYVEISDGVNLFKSDKKVVTVEGGKIDKSKLPALVISEILPDSSNINGADAYEFIEIYNNSNMEVNLKDYRLYYNYPDNGDNSDVLWANISEDVYLQSGECVVFWIKDGKNNSLNIDDFNNKFGTSLELNKNLFEIYTGGMANGSARALRLTSNVNDQIDFVAYNMGGIKDVVADKSIKYVYDAVGNCSNIINNSSNPTPGSISDDEKPWQAELKIPEENPVIEDLTEETFDNNIGLKFNMNAIANNTTIKTVKLYYKDNTMDDYEMYYLSRDNGDNYNKIIEAVDLLGKKYYEYKFEVSDGFNTTASEVKRINSSLESQENIRFNISDGTYLAGTTSVITTGEKLYIDNVDVSKDTVDSIENKAKIVFDVSQTDTFFKNAVAIGDEVLGIFNEGTYNEWATVSYDVDPSYFIKGKSIQIDIHAGNKANALEHNEENNDDFVVKNIRLVLPDGRTLRAEGYEDPEKVISMGDSSGKIEILNAVFTPENVSFNSLRYTLDSNKLTDGMHIISSTNGEEKGELKVIVDNTAPNITTNMEEGKTYKGTVEVTANANDELSGTKNISATLDGRAIELPYEFRSLEITSGIHTLVLKATDNCGNESSKTINFIIPEENPSLGMNFKPAAGEILNNDPTFSLEAMDPTDDIMSVSFKRGERYILGDKNIISTTGVSDTTGSNNNIFEDESGNGFPYEEFDVEVGNNITENADIKIEWTGKSNNKKTKMYVYNYVNESWDIVPTTFSENDDELKLIGTVSLKNHLSNNKVKAMVQNGEGYTPTQYEAGAEALVPTNPVLTTSNINDLDRNNYDFTFAVESDTQYYNEDTEDNPSIVGKYQYQLDIHDWLIANRPRMNIQYLFHNGDIIDDENMESQWVNADNAYKMIDDAALPYGILAGNHDVGHLSGDYTSYSKYFGESRFNNNPWYGGSYKDNRAHYDLITVNGIDFIMMYTGWGIGDEEIEWMNEVLQKYPERKAILNFHEYLLASGGLGEEPQRVYDEVVAKNSNVCMVLSGHYHNAQTVVSEFDDNKDGVNDRKVYQMLFDYQGLTEGGMGYIRLMHFDMDNEKVVFRTYSPSLDDYDAKDNKNINSENIVGEEEFEISFKDLGIVPQVKTLSTDDLQVNVYTDEVIGTVNNIKNNDEVSFTWENVLNGVYGWYGEVTDEFGGLTRTDVNYFTVDKKDDKPQDLTPEIDNNKSEENNIANSGKEENNITEKDNKIKETSKKKVSNKTATGDSSSIPSILILILSAFGLYKTRK